MILVQNDLGHEPSRVYRLCWTVTAISASVSFGYSAAAVLMATGAAETSYAMYAAARSVAILAAVLAASRRRRTDSLFVLACLMAGIQGLDALVGAHSHDLIKTVGPACTAAVGLAAAVRLRRLERSV